MPTSLADVCSLFDRYGYKYHQHDERTLLIALRGTSLDFTLGARLDRSWLSLSIVKHLPVIPADRREEVCAYLLRLNHQITFVRFALESDADIALLADLPAQEKPDYDLFAMAVDLITFYADDSYRYLYQLITGGEPAKDDMNEDRDVG